MRVQYIPADDNEKLPEEEPSVSRPREESPLDNPTAFKNYSHQKEQYHHIEKRLLFPGTEVTFSLFLFADFKARVLVEASETSPARVGTEIPSVEGDLVIKKTDLPRYSAYLDSLLASSHASDRGDIRVKAVAVRENSKIVLKELLENPRSGEEIKKSTEAVNGLITCILENREAIFDMLSLRNYDYYTYTHSVNVAVLSIGMGIALSLPKDDVQKLGIGAMLHDLGKSTIPVEILNKQGKLSAIEYGLMKSHVLEGEKILSAHREIPGESLTAVLQHHEKLSGRGYPNNLSGREIQPFGRITAIADCYDALTTRRPYKAAFTPFDALTVIVNETRDYDADLLSEFIRMLGKVT